MYGEDEFNPDPFEAKLKWIDGACYRIYDRKASTVDDTNSRKRNVKPYFEYDEDEQDDDVEACSGDTDKSKDCNVTETESGRYKTTISIPHKFYAYIIGTKGSRKKQLENETKTEITIPRSYTDKNIVINGPTITNVVSAKRRIELMAMGLREKHMITHFISFPLISDEVKQNFIKFKESLLNEEPPIKGVDESIFTKTDKLHLTIGTLVLLDEEEIKNAADVLNKMKEEIIDPFIQSTGPITLHVKGLQYMNDDPSNVDVLYAKVDVVGHETNHQIQKLSDEITDFFFKSGIMKKDYDAVKLHATLMNTRYRRERSPAKSDARQQKRIHFNAKPILEKYGDYDFGLQPLTTIHLSCRTTVDKNGYYGCRGSINLEPSSKDK